MDTTPNQHPGQAKLARRSGKRAAVIGVGAMGLGMAQSLARAGFDVAGYDIAPDALEKLVQSGVAAAGSVAEAAAQADFVVTAVVNDAQTRSVLFGPASATSVMKPGGIIISSATMPPGAARALAAEAEARGVGYLDAPVSGGPAKATTGQLTVMASGAPDTLAQATPALAAMATTIYELGSDVGIASSFKIVNQLLAGVHIAAACEAITLAKRMGLDLDTVYKVITSSAGNSWMFENRIPHVLEGDYKPLSAIDIFVKDLGIANDIGRTRSFPLPMAATALQMFLMTSAAGMGKDDDASIARMIARIAGLDLPGEPAAS